MSPRPHWATGGGSSLPWTVLKEEVRPMKKTRLLTASASLAASALVLTAAPAFASTHSGSMSCSGGAKLVSHGQQQRLTWLAVYVNGSLRDRFNSTYELDGKSTATSGTWSATSDSLLYSGTFGYCSGSVA